MKKTLSILLTLILVSGMAALIAQGIYRYTEFKKYGALWDDTERIATEEYDCVFFSTFPIHRFSAKDYIKFRNQHPIMSSYIIPDYETLNAYFTNVSETGNEVDLAYLGIRPDIISADELYALISTWDEKRYEVLIAYPSLEYWKKLDEEEYPAILNTYANFIQTIMTDYADNEYLQEHLGLYFYGSTEWLVANSTNYESDFGVNEYCSHMLSVYTDGDHGYQLTPENYEEVLEDFEMLVSDCREVKEFAEYPDLSKWDVVFFGDSVMASSETFSIPGAFSSLTGAHVYNCAVGGSTATMLGEKYLGIPVIVDIFCAQDLELAAKKPQAKRGLSEYIQYSRKKRQKCFVISFGLNDFYSGQKVEGNDPNDIYTFAGALRTAVDKLQAAYPNAVILLMAPNFTSYFGDGMEPQSEEGGSMPDYVSAVSSICEEKGLFFYNSYTELGINGSNHFDYLKDGTHPTESTLYTMAQGIAKVLMPLTEEEK